jgi:hypothetical protein
LDWKTNSAITPDLAYYSAITPDLAYFLKVTEVVQNGTDMGTFHYYLT